MRNQRNPEGGPSSKFSLVQARSFCIATIGQRLMNDAHPSGIALILFAQDRRVASNVPHHIEKRGEVTSLNRKMGDRGRQSFLYCCLFYKQE